MNLHLCIFYLKVTPPYPSTVYLFQPGLTRVVHGLVPGMDAHTLYGYNTLNDTHVKSVERNKIELYKLDLCRRCTIENQVI